VILTQTKKRWKKKIIENNKLVQNQKNHRKPNLENAISQLKCQKTTNKAINNQIVNMMFILSRPTTPPKLAIIINLLSFRVFFVVKLNNNL
jgi:hypothetical protein